MLTVQASSLTCCKLQCVEHQHWWGSQSLGSPNLNSGVQHPGLIGEKWNLQYGFPGAVHYRDFVLDSLMSFLIFWYYKGVLSTGENLPTGSVFELCPNICRKANLQLFYRLFSFFNSAGDQAQALVFARQMPLPFAVALSSTYSK